MRISGRGQITIPKPLRERFGLHPDAEVEITPSEDGVLIRRCDAAEHPVDRVSGILGKPGMAGMPIDVVDEYVREIRGH